MLRLIGSSCGALDEIAILGLFDGEIHRVSQGTTSWKGKQREGYAQRPSTTPAAAGWQVGCKNTAMHCCTTAMFSFTVIQLLQLPLQLLQLLGYSGRCATARH